MWWATTSCSSRAMRSRSSTTRRRASSSRDCSARRARSSTARTYSSRVRIASPTATAIPIQATVPIGPGALHESPVSVTLDR